MRKKKITVNDLSPCQLDPQADCVECDKKWREECKREIDQALLNDNTFPGTHIRKHITFMVKCGSPNSKRCKTCPFRNETEFGMICNLNQQDWGGRITVTIVRENKC